MVDLLEDLFLGALDRLDALVLRIRLRMEDHPVDLVEERQRNDLIILWPISEDAKTFMSEEITWFDQHGRPSEPTFKRGGYLVTWAMREQIHHGGLPLIASRCRFGRIIDTP